MKKNLLFLLIFSFYANLITAQNNVIPKPNHVEIGSESPFQISLPSRLQFSKVSRKSQIQFQDYLIGAGFNISTEKSAKAIIELSVEKKLSGVTSAEGYILRMSNRIITIQALSEAGLFYAVQTLLQLAAEDNSLPQVTITDSPRFPYRGMHLDVSRHFYSVEFIKKHLDMMAHLKLNRFHWHLTDGPGWRLEIKKYPFLTQKAAWRTHETWKEWWATNPRKYVDINSGETAYGGFYTQKEARDIVKYASDRHITVIPEIEMPGHSEEVLAVYPQLSCVGEPYKQSEFCIGNEQTFVFLQNVLKEVMMIFPSEYIHIGGDEADKSHWAKCPKCQARMQKENLQDVDELQSYLIRRIEKFLIKNNRKLIGWDEILDGGLAPEATVMSWRGEEGGINAAKQGHDVVMTPGGYMYLDSYQTNPANAPEAIGGFLPLEKVYSYNPVPTILTPNEAKHILGVQSNLWTEYISTEDHVDYMLYPRVLAVSEVAWTQPQYKEWNDFKKRANLKIPYLQEKGIKTFTLSDEVFFEHHIDSVDKKIVVTLSTEKYDADIRYTTDGNTPTDKSEIFTQPLLLDDSTTITAQLFENDRSIGKPIKNRFDYHKGIDKKVIYNIPINRYYPAGGEKSLVNGEKGGNTHTDGRWQGFMTQGMDVTIDMGEKTYISYISSRFMQSVGPWIYFPKEVVISISDDNKNFKELTRIPTPFDENTAGTILYEFGWNGSATGRYINYKAVPNGIKGGWVFLDEIVVW